MIQNEANWQAEYILGQTSNDQFIVNGMIIDKLRIEFNNYLSSQTTLHKTNKKHNNIAIDMIVINQYLITVDRVRLGLTRISKTIPSFKTSLLI